MNGGTQNHSQQQNHHQHRQTQDSQRNSSGSSSTNGTSNNNNSASADLPQHLQQQARSHHDFVSANGVTPSDPFASMNSSKALTLGSRSGGYGLMTAPQLYGQLPASLSPLSLVSPTRLEHSKVF